MRHLMLSLCAAGALAFSAAPAKADHWSSGPYHSHYHGYHSGYPYYGGYGYPYASGGYYDDDCYVVRRRVLTPYGWRIRRAVVCG